MPGRLDVAFVLGAVAGLLGGCAATQAPLRAPDIGSVSVGLTHFKGSPMEGARASRGAAEKEARDPADALELKARVILCAGALPPVFEPLGVKSRLLVATSGRRPFLAASPLARDARVALLADDDVWNLNLGQLYPATESVARPAGAWVSADYCRSALVHTATTSIDVEAPERFLVGSSPGITAVRVQLHRYGAQGTADGGAATPGARIQVVLIIEARGFPEVSRDFGDEQPAGSEAARAEDEGRAVVVTRTPRGIDREVFVVADRVLPPYGGWAIAAPLCGEGFARGQYAIVVASVAKPPAPDAVSRRAHEEAVGRCVGDLAAQDAAAESPEAAGFQRALEGLRWPAKQRKALSFLAETTGAEVTADVCITGTQAIVARLSDAVAKAARETPGARDRAAMGWIVERVTLETLAALLAEKKLPLELEAVLVRHAGEAGRNPASLAELLKGAKGLGDLRSGIARENLIALEDASPAARVRAFDWLSARGTAPAGFDPLASTKERRLALEKALEIPETNPTGTRQP